MKSRWALAVVAVLAISWANAQEADPLCPSNAGTGEWGKGNFKALQGSEAQMAPMRAALSAQHPDQAPFATTFLGSAVRRSLSRPEIQQTVEPEPTAKVRVGDKLVNIDADTKAVVSCVDAIQTLHSKTPIPRERTYACALLDVDRKCLTSSESQLHVKDSGIPRRAVAITTVGGEAVCTGILLNDHSLRTARHCFVNQVSGDLRPEFLPSATMKVDITTLDGQRSLTLSPAELQRLKLPGGFDIDKDAVTVAVTAVATSSAAPLPEVRLVPPAKHQLLWLVGPVFLLDQAIAMQKFAANPKVKPPLSDWRDSVRWSSLLGGQCRTVAVQGACIYHSCQSFRGFSGSPLITAAYEANQGAVIEYAGVHSGTPGMQQPAGWPGCAHSGPAFKASDFFVFNVGEPGE